MIVVLVTYQVQPGSVEKVLALSNKAREIAQTERGYVEYCAMPSPNENEIKAIEQWETLDDLKAHIASDGCKEFVANREPYLVEGTKVTKVYEAKPVEL